MLKGSVQWLDIVCLVEEELLGGKTIILVTQVAHAAGLFPDGSNGAAGKRHTVLAEVEGLASTICSM